MSKHIFISYSRKDETFARQIATDLSNAGAEVWIDMDDIPVGLNWSRAIQQGLDASRVLLLILSPESMASINVENEWQFYLDSGKAVIPLYWRECRPHFQLNRLNYIDFREGKADYQQAFNRLLKALQREGVQLDQQPTPETAKEQRVSEIIRAQAAAEVKKNTFPLTWIITGLGAVLLALVIAGVLLSGGDDANPEPTSTQAAIAQQPSETPTAIDTLPPTATASATPLIRTQVVLDITATALAIEAGYTATPTATASQTPDFTATYLQDREDFIAGITATALTATAAAWTATPTPTPDPDLGLVADVPVTVNAQWTPIIREFEGAEMVLVPIGCFMMGSNTDEDDESPIHQECFDHPFWLDRYEFSDVLAAQVEGREIFTNQAYPYTRISWSSARDLCGLRGMRLPTEREWEYAARGPSNLIYPWGDDLQLENVAYWGSATNEKQPIGSYPGGVAWIGAFDMVGNVWEWIDGWYVAYGGTGAADSPYRVIRGSSVESSKFDLRASNRSWINPEIAFNDVGFRCARDFVPEDLLP